MKRISDSSVRRLSLYLRALEDALAHGRATISSEALARASGTTSAQVRKDLSMFGSFGKRGLGYGVAELAERLRGILGLGRRWRIVIVGAGKIGIALAQYHGFRDRGFDLVGMFDRDPDRVGRRVGGVTVRGVNRFEHDVRGLAADVAIVTVPADAAQGVVDQLSRAGVRGILNFAPTAVRATDGAAIRNVNMALELEALAYALTQGAD